MTLFRDVDRPLLIIIGILMVGGFFILLSASLPLSSRDFGTPFYYALRQLAFGVLTGALFFFIALAIPYKFWKKAAVPALAGSLVLMALLFIPDLSYSFGGATRWLVAGPISFQPSEILKLAFIIYLASWLSSRKKEVASASHGTIPFLLMLAVVGAFLMMQPDLGTFVAIALTAGLMFFIGGSRMVQVFTIVALGFAALFILVQLAPYRLARLAVFLNPNLDPQGIGYQITQATIAIGSGGFWGVGFGEGLQKRHFLPEPMGDSIFAIFAEETGFLGASALIAIFLLFIWRGFHIARRAPDPFGMLLAAGITAGVAAQAFINMAAISGLLPLTGIPLPFVSYGSSALVATLGGMGILLNISKNT